MGEIEDRIDKFLETSQRGLMQREAYIAAIRYAVKVLNQHGLKNEVNELHRIPQQHLQEFSTVGLKFWKNSSDVSTCGNCGQGFELHEFPLFVCPGQSYTYKDETGNVEFPTKASQRENY